MVQEILQHLSKQRFALDNEMHLQQQMEDVLAGYGIGFLWISGCIALLRFKLSTPPWLN